MLVSIFSKLHNEKVTVFEMIFQNKHKKPVASDFGFGFLFSVIIPIFYNVMNDRFSRYITLICFSLWVWFIKTHRIFRIVFDTHRFQTNVSSHYNGTKFLLVSLSYK